MTSAVTSLPPATNGSPTNSTIPPGAADTAAFNSAAQSGAGASTNAGLTVNGNTIDTGRYVITASNDYTRPQTMGGGTANDGMLTVYDTQTHSSVEVFGDPHVYTSSGDQADFQADGLTLNLGDGTQVQFKPTAETNGVSHIDEVAVSKNNQTVTQAGFDTGAVSTSGIQQGGPSSTQGFNDVRDTVLNAGSDGSLGTLTNTMGAQLNSTGYQEALDGMGGGYSAFANSSGTDAMRQYSNAMTSNAGGSGGPNAASEPNATAASASPAQTGASSGASSDVASSGAPSGATPASASAASAGPSSETALLQQLIGLLQQELSGGAKDAGAAARGAAPQGAATQSGAAPQSAAAAPSSQGGEASLIQQLISMLQQILGGKQGDGATASLIGQLLPLLQKKLDSLSSGPVAANAAAGAATQDTALMQQLVSDLGGQSSGQSAAPVAGAGTQTAAAAQPQAAPASYNPAMGISPNEIQAMLAEANGTGPQIEFAQYDQAATNYAQNQGSSTAGGQVANLGSQMGGEAA